MPNRQVRAVMRQLPDGWVGRILDDEREVRSKTRSGCLGAIRRRAGERSVLTVEITSDVVGVSEAAAILGWDRRRVVTYVDRGAFPLPIATLSSGRVWRRDDVEAFARDRARRPRSRIKR